MDLDEWEEYAIGHHLGAEKPSLVIVVWGDYQCPVCRWFHRQVTAVLERHPLEVGLVFRHWPLAYHEHAYPAARAAVCAARQGAFEPFHSNLFGDTGWMEGGFVDRAVESGVQDPGAFVECVQGDAPDPVVERDVSAAKELGGLGTPTIIFNGRLLARTPDSLRMEEMIREARARG